MTNLRNEAQGETCEVRVPECCNSDQETTVLAHYRVVGISGMGMKSPDLIAAHACSRCHDAVDGRIRTLFTRQELRLMHLEGVARTQAKLIERGIVKW